MPAYYKIDKERRVVMSTVAGVFTLADGLAHQEKLLKDPHFDPSFSGDTGTRRLLSEIPLSYDDCRNKLSVVRYRTF